MKRKLLRALKRVWFFSFLRRLKTATSFFNYKYWQILKWGFRSREYTNYTYPLKESNIRYLAMTISVVLKQDYPTVMGYINELQADDTLRSHIQTVTAKTELRKFADKDVYYGRRLGWYVFARVMKPKVIIETGVDKGLGSVVMCAALLRNQAEGFDGRYYGTDINPEAGYLLTGVYQTVGQIFYGDSITSLTAFNQPIDLFINDSDHSDTYEYQEYRTIADKLSPNAIILGDNAHCTDKLAQFCLETGRHFLFFQEVPKDHWYPGAGIGIGFRH